MSPRTPLAIGRPWVKICGVTRPEDADAAAELGAGLIGLNFWNGSPRRVAPGAVAEIVAAVAGRALLAGVFVNEAPERIDELVAAHGLDLVQLHGDEPASYLDHYGARAIRALSYDLAVQDFSVQDKDKDQRLPVKGEGVADAEVEAGRRGGGSPSPAARNAEPEGGASGEVVDRRRGGKGSFRTAEPLRGESSPEQGIAGAASPNWKSLSFVLSKKIFAFLVDAPAGRRYGGTGVAWDWSAARAVVAASAAPVLVAGGIRAENVASALAASGAAGVDVASGVESAPGVKDRERMARLFEEVGRVAT